VLPWLDRDFGFDVAGSLVRLAGLARSDRAFIDEAVARALADVVTGRGGDSVELNAARLLGLHPYLAAEVLQEVFARLGGSPVGADKIDRIVQLAVRVGKGSRTLPLGGGFEARLEYDRLRIARARTRTASRPAGGEVAITVPGSAVIPGTGRRIETSGPFGGRYPEGVVGEDPTRERIDADAIDGPLVARAAAAGDRFRPLGLGGAKKLQDFFVDLKVPASSRWRTPVVADRRGIIWVAGYRIDGRVRITPRTRRWIDLRVSSEAEDA